METRTMNAAIEERDQTSKGIATALWIVAAIVLIGLLSYYSMRHTRDNIATGAAGSSVTTGAPASSTDVSAPAAATH